MKRIDLNFYPGWVRKAITFTIDDGNIPLDRKFMAITKPAGLRGTFNLCTPIPYDRYDITPAELVQFYQGYEIANHCYRHVYPKTKQTERPIKNEPFSKETSDPAFAYPTEETDIYHVFTYGWARAAYTDDAYMRCVKRCQEELESLFGKGKIRSYVWPCGEQQNEAVFQRIAKEGFQSSRFAHPVKNLDGYSIPKDRMRWSYNADYSCMTETAAEYDALPDDGSLKFYCFGVHSHDFENNGKWDVLEDFCKKYGNRPNDFWYASVGDVFDYEDAVKSVRINEKTIENPSSIDLSIKIDGQPTVIKAKSSIKI